MTQRDVFEIAEVRHVKDDLWLVRGRAYEDLKVGDVLSIAVPDRDDTTDGLSFKIMTISSYGFSIDTLYRVMTGDLTLCGPHGDRLSEASTLVQRYQPSKPPVLATEHD